MPTDRRRLPGWARLLLAVVLLLLGLVVGLAAVVIHARTPGLVLGLLATSAAAYALPPGATTRLPFCLGWVLLVGYATAPRPEGDYVVGQNVPGYVLLGFTLALGLYAVATLRGRPREEPDRHVATAAGRAPEA